MKYLKKYNSAIKYSLSVIGSGTIKQYYQKSIVLLLIGGSIGIYFNNFILSIVMAIGLPLIQYLLLIKRRFDNQRNHTEMLEIYMSMVTNAYMQSEDLESAIIESYGRMNKNESASRPFGAFIGESAGNADIEKCITNMQKDMQNEYFKQWCDKLVLCRQNVALKYVLPYVVNRMRQKRTLESEAFEESEKHYADYLFIVVFVLILSFVFPMQNEILWYAVTCTGIGKLLIAFITIVIILASIYVAAGYLDERH